MNNTELEIIFIRHGSTEYNRTHKYLGRKDEPLCDLGIQQAQERFSIGVPQVDRVFSSPLIRCVQTARIVFPEHEPVIVPNFIEIDFGRFEGRTHEQLYEDDPAYRIWIEGTGTNDSLEIPGGETRGQLTARSVKGFYDMLEQCGSCSRVAAAVHSGTIMAVVSSLMKPHKEFYDCYIGNCATWAFKWDGKNLLPL